MMKLNDVDRMKINKASTHITEAITKTLAEMAPQLVKKFEISGPQLNVAIAKSAMVNLTSSVTAAAVENNVTVEQATDIALELAKQIEPIVWKALGVEP